MTSARILLLLLPLLILGCAPDPETIGATPELLPAAGAEPDGAQGTPETDGEQPSEQPAAAPEEPGDPIPGVDVSMTDLPADWTKVKAGGVAFAFVQATVGVDTVDAAFEKNWVEAKRAGLVRGGFAVYLPGADPEAQARHLLATTKPGSGDLPPTVVVGLGDPPTKPREAFGAELKTFLAVLEEATGGKPIVATSPDFWNEHVAGSFGEYPLWVRQTGVDEPTLPTGWDGWTFWQHTLNDEVEGMEGKANQDTFAESLSSLKGLALP